LKVRFKRAGSEFGTDWDLILQTRDAVRIYNAKTGASYTRKGGPGAFDPIFDLNPWGQLFICCPPTGGRPWVELIGPHPAMAAVIKDMKFEYATLADGSIKQTRRDPGGWVNEIVFASAHDYLVSSLIQYDPKGAIQQEVKFRYRRVGKAIVPVECESYSVSERPGAIVRFTYKYSNWDAKPVSRAELSPEQFARVAEVQKRPKANETANAGARSAEDELRGLGEKLREKGFAKP
jgi:hypothetical protein